MAGRRWLYGLVAILQKLRKVNLCTDGQGQFLERLEREGYIR